MLLQHSSDRDWLVVNTAMYMSISHAMRVGAFMLLGFSISPWWPLLLALLVAVTAGSWVGTRLRAHIPAVNFRRWFRLLVTALALRMIAMPLLDL